MIEKAALTPDELHQGAEPGELHQVKTSWSPYDHLSDGMRARLRRGWRSLGFDRRVASDLRYEMDMLLLRSRCALSPAYRRQVRDLAGRRGLTVHLGCGNALFPGWLNVDCYPPSSRNGAEVLTVDMRRGLPLADQSVQAVFSEHFLEHLSVETVRTVILPELRRVLEPGGRARLAVPDGEYFVGQYMRSRRGETDPLFEANRGAATPMTMLNDIAHGFGHRFLYDFETLSGLLKSAGFTNVERGTAGHTDTNAFFGKDRIDPWRQAMSLYVEATVPSL
jgi:predicted SAM-dependent methyltransferase